MHCSLPNHKTSLFNLNNTNQNSFQSQSPLKNNISSLYTTQNTFSNQDSNKLANQSLFGTNNSSRNSTLMRLENLFTQKPLNSNLNQPFTNNTQVSPPVNATMNNEKQTLNGFNLQNNQQC